MTFQLRVSHEQLLEGVGFQRFLPGIIAAAHQAANVPVDIMGSAAADVRVQILRACMAIRVIVAPEAEFLSGGEGNVDGLVGTGDGRGHGTCRYSG